MEKTTAQIRAMKDEIVGWMEQHELTVDTGWREIREHYGDEEKTFPFPHYLVLWFEGDLHEVLWLLPDHPDYKALKKLREDFKGIIEKHGCWFEFENNTTLCVMDKQSRESGE